MLFENVKPTYENIGDLECISNFNTNGKKELELFLINLLNLKKVRFQFCSLETLKTWLNVEELTDVMLVPNSNNEVCLISQIKVDNQVIAYFPYVLVGDNVTTYFYLKSFLSKLAEAISDQITMCYLNKFKGTNWIFGENLARMVVANCISTKKYDGIDFAHLIEKIEQLSSATFEGEFFSTGVIVTSDLAKYKSNFFKFSGLKNIDFIEKREWYLANGKETFFVINSKLDSYGIYRKTLSVRDRSNNENETTDFSYIREYFDDYYLKNDLVNPDFIVRTVGPNEISVSDTDGKEFVKIENVWRYRHSKSFASFIHNKIGVDYKICYAILYYTMYCSRNHISSILWMPDNCSNEEIEKFTIRCEKILDRDLDLLDESHRELIEKILASDGAIVINKEGKIIFECVFANMKSTTKRIIDKDEHSEVDSSHKNIKSKLSGTGETATKILSQNGIAIKISQDGTIKMYYANEKYFY